MHPAAIPAGSLPLWHLHDSCGMTATCSLQRIGQAWLVVVAHGTRSWIWEQHRLEDSAMARAAEVYGILAELGFQERMH